MLDFAYKAVENYSAKPLALGNFFIEDTQLAAQRTYQTLEHQGTTLYCYKSHPRWHADGIPAAFTAMHNTKEHVYAQLTIWAGALEFFYLDAAGNVTQSAVFDQDHQPPLIEPQIWHKIAPKSADLEVELKFYCAAQHLAYHKYQLTPSHSELVGAMGYLAGDKALDLGCGRGRNTVLLQALGFEVDAVDVSAAHIEFLQTIHHQQPLAGVNCQLMDISSGAFLRADYYDLIVSTVVLMFLPEYSIADIIHNMQASTKVGGLNLIVCAMDTPEYPKVANFSFGFKPNELAQFYEGWELIKYNEDVGHLHRRNEAGEQIELQFATMLARKL